MTFDKLTGSQLAEWRAQPATQLFLEWLAWATDMAARECVEQLSKGEVERAKATAGRSLGLEQVIGQVMRQDAPEPEPEEEFVDPAYRFSPELAPKYEEGLDDVGTD